MALDGIYAQYRCVAYRVNGTRCSREGYYVVDGLRFCNQHLKQRGLYDRWRQEWIDARGNIRVGALSLLATPREVYRALQRAPR